MASPAKRRKKNDQTSPPATARSLDYFFGKQSQASGAKKADVATIAAQVSSRGTQKAELTDEELARQLQEEWNHEALPALSVQDPQHRGQSGGELDVDGGTDSNGHITTCAIPTEVPREPEPSGVDAVDTALSIPRDAGQTKTLSLQSNASAEDTISATIPFDESPLTFQHLKYIDGLKQHWASEGGHASYALLTRCFVLVNSTQSRIKIVDTLVNFLRLVIQADPESLLPAVR